MSGQQSGSKVAFQGVKGAYSEDAVYSYFGEGVETVPCQEFTDLFEAVDRGKATHGVLPVENSIEGSVTLANDLLLESDLTVIGEILLPIRHCLIGQKDAELLDVRKVYSHPQALGQSRNFLMEHPEWEKIPSFDTAGSVLMIKQRGLREEAAVASRRAAEHYGMKVLREGIQNSNKNCTRFFVLEKDPKTDHAGGFRRTRGEHHQVGIPSTEGAPMGVRVLPGHRRQRQRSQRHQGPHRPGAQGIFREGLRLLPQGEAAGVGKASPVFRQ